MHTKQHTLTYLLSIQPRPGKKSDRCTAHGFSTIPCWPLSFHALTAINVLWQTEAHRDKWGTEGDSVEGASIEGASISHDIHLPWSSSRSGAVASIYSKKSGANSRSSSRIIRRSTCYRRREV
jgi:hypothetical protein